ncbi:hypothetical protein [Silvimonas sp.]|uniref:hypothetical protein n=1 Tax=Silvimonas sp. TaxID=2650811 RepID=UPI002841D74D|nr:hypothetical protein [Silvimonas sp.]MDR3427917.1 hypothetical protein [Silvimonas sp.]
MDRHADSEVKMRVVVYQLRQDGKRVEEGTHLDRPVTGLLSMASTETVNYHGHMLQIGTRGPRNGQFDHVVPPLYEPKLVDMRERSGKWRMRFIGFQAGKDGAGVVQEWLCEIG